MTLPWFADKPRPRAAVLIVGNELLSGDITDLNGPYMLRGLRRRGVEVGEVRYVGDDTEAIAAAIVALRAHVDGLFVAGGIGPTHDDVTLEALATAFGTELILHPELTRRVAAYFGPTAAKEAMNLARVPKGSTVAFGSLQLVPQLSIGNVCVLPGVPKLLKRAFDDVLGDAALGPPFVRRDLRLQASEPTLVAQLAQLQHDHPQVALGCYPSFEARAPEVRLSIQGRREADVEGATLAVLAIWPQAEVLLPG